MARSPKPDPGENDPVAITIAAWVGARPHGERITVACSGGLDSTVLLHALTVACRSARPDLELRAHHVHHGLLPEADGWLRQVETLCAGLGIACSSELVSVETGSGHGLEAAARRARYASYARLSTDCLVLAHHADDQTETVLLQFLRGGGPRALAGMPARRTLGALVIERPLLGLPRLAIAHYAERHGLRGVTDPSNADPRLARSRLRHSILPLLREVFPGLDRRLAQAAREHADASALLDALARADLAHCSDGQRLDLAAWQRLDPARRRNALRRWLLDAGTANPGWAAIAELATQLSRLPSGLRFPLRALGPEPIIEVRTYRGQATLRACGTRQPFGRLPDVLTGPGRWATGHGVLTASLADAALTARAAQGLALPVARGRPHWRLRLREPGDRIRLSERSGHVPLKNVFQAHGVPPWERVHWPLVCDGDEPIAVSGLALNDRYADAGGLFLEWKPWSATEDAKTLPDSPAMGEPPTP